MSLFVEQMVLIMFGYPFAILGFFVYLFHKGFDCILECLCTHYSIHNEYDQSMQKLNYIAT